MQPNPALVRFLWMAVILLAFIGLAVATRRAVVLFDRGTPTAPNNPAAALDAHFADHRPLTLAHIRAGRALHAPRTAPVCASHSLELSAISPLVRPHLSLQPAPLWVLPA